MNRGMDRGRGIDIDEAFLCDSCSHPSLPLVSCSQGCCAAAEHTHTSVIVSAMLQEGACVLSTVHLLHRSTAPHTEKK
jgi:hypothetical protein